MFVIAVKHPIYYSDLCFLIPVTDKPPVQSNQRVSILSVLLGRPLANSEAEQERIGPSEGIPIFGLDALSSAAYGPEAALTILIPLGMAGVAYIVPISLSILVLLGIVYVSYCQTIEAYPGGGGSYTVARENLGANAGLLAGTALMIDYTLNVAVGISAGVGALVSAAPGLQKHTLGLCLLILAVLTLVNLRGAREAGVAFMLPTYLFIGSLLIMIAIGAAKTLASGGHPVAVIPPPQLKAAVTGVSWWLLIKAFSSGCTAMTGVEAVSNGVQAFREPVSKMARLTLTIIIGLLMIMLGGIAYLCSSYHVGATPPGTAGYQSVLSQLTAAVAGNGVFYWVTIGSILLVLSLSANSSFAGFPRLCRIIARDSYLPFGFTLRGRRLVYSYGIYVLTALSAVLLIIFGGVTDRLIPLFAIGAFLSFTLSQAGMVEHWRRQKQGRISPAMIVNALGATATGITVLIVIAAKLTEGAWITLVLIPLLLGVMLGIHRHYDRVWAQIAAKDPMPAAPLPPPLIIVPLESWNKVSRKALRFALTLSPDVQAVHVDCGEETDELQKRWDEWVKGPTAKLGVPVPKLTIVKSPYRFVVTPILDHVIEVERKHKGREILVVLPQLIEPHWYHFLLHNQRAQVLSALLMLKGERRIAVVNVPWYLNE